jgi:membrane protein YqaA with SNARE-associated domain
MSATGSVPGSTGSTGSASSSSTSSAAHYASIGLIVELAGAAAFLGGAVLSVHHYAIAACTVGGAAAYFVGKKLRAAATSL